MNPTQNTETNTPAPVTPSKPSPGAMRAARALWPYGVASCYAFSTEEENDAARLRDWEKRAQIIDTETGAGELAEALETTSQLLAFDDNTPADDLRANIEQAREYITKALVRFNHSR